MEKDWDGSWCALRTIQNKPSSMPENPFLLKQLWLLWSKDIWQQYFFCSANDVVGKEQTILGAQAAHQNSR